MEFCEHPKICVHLDGSLCLFENSSQHKNYHYSKNSKNKVKSQFSAILPVDWRLHRVSVSSWQDTPAWYRSRKKIGKCSVNSYESAVCTGGEILQCWPLSPDVSCSTGAVVGCSTFLFSVYSTDILCERDTEDTRRTRRICRAPDEVSPALQIECGESLCGRTCLFWFLTAV